VGRVCWSAPGSELTESRMVRCGWCAVLCVLLASALGSFEGEEPLNSPQAQQASTDNPYLTREFDSVKNFALDIDGMRETVKDREACEVKCLERDSCRSYSWSPTGTKDKPGRTCIWSAKYIGFDPEWVFHTRTYGVDVSGQLTMTGPFRSFPGMRFVEDRFHSETTGVTEDECKQSCEADGKCMAFSYSDSTRECLLSDSAVRFVPGFTYYERNQPVAGKKGKFKYYPKPESRSQKRETQKVQLKEMTLAETDKLAREKKEQKADTVRKQMQQKTELKESTDKAAQKQREATHEQTAKHVALQKQLIKDEKVAEERGKYSETVQKASGNVLQARLKYNKERRAKTAVAKAKANESMKKAHEKDKEDANEMALKKKVSKLTADLASTEKVTARLQYEKAARLIQVEAFKLAQKERQSKGKMPPAITKLISEELKLERIAADKRQFLQNNEQKFKEIEEEKQRSIREHKQERRDQKRMHQSQTRLMKMQQEEEINKTQKMVANAGPETQLAMLKIQDARERVQMLKDEKMFDSLAGRDVIIMANSTSVCRASGLKKSNIFSKSSTDSFFNQGGGSIKCQPLSDDDDLEDIKFKFRVQSAGGYPAIAFKVASQADKPESGRMCAAEGSAEGNGPSVLKCRSPVPDILGAKLPKSMKLVVTSGVTPPGTFAVGLFGGTNKFCRLESTEDDGIVCDSTPVNREDAATLFKIFPADGLIQQGKNFFPLETKRACADKMGKLQTASLELAMCKVKCCESKQCQFFNFIPAKEGSPTPNVGQCELFQTCNKLTKRADPAMIQSTIYQKTGIGCHDGSQQVQDLF